MEHPEDDNASMDMDTDQENNEASEPETTASKPAKATKTILSDSKPDEIMKDSTTSAVDDGKTPAASTSPLLVSQDLISEYIRVAHGLHLEELALNRIPMKASLLTKALDMTALRRLTLLQTGSQDVLWHLLVRVNTKSSLHLESIHTDDVSSTFVKFLYGIHGLKELFLLKRKTKGDRSVEEKQPVKISDLCFVLPKHVRTLERLSIRNEHDTHWDCDPRTLMILRSRSKNLKELALSVQSTVYVSFCVLESCTICFLPEKIYPFRPRSWS